MKELGLSLGIVSVALAVVAAVVFGAGDESTFVPAPEVAAEEFARELSTERYEVAWRQMARDARQREREEHLRERFEPVLERLGKVNSVDGQETFRDGNTSTATANIDGDNGAVTLVLTMNRESGLWKVDRWDVARAAGGAGEAGGPVRVGRAGSRR